MAKITIAPPNRVAKTAPKGRSQTAFAPSVKNQSRPKQPIEAMHPPTTANPESSRGTWSHELAGAWFLNIDGSCDHGSRNSTSRPRTPPLGYKITTDQTTADRPLEPPNKETHRRQLKPTQRRKTFPQTRGPAQKGDKEGGCARAAPPPSF